MDGQKFFERCFDGHFLNQGFSSQIVLSSEQVDRLQTQTEQ